MDEVDLQLNVIFEQLRVAVVDNPRQLLVLCTQRDNPMQVKSSGYLKILMADHVDDLPELTKEGGFTVLCYWWRGQYYRVKPNGEVEKFVLPVVN